jgi:hypothetical protein
MPTHTNKTTSHDSEFRHSHTTKTTRSSAPTTANDIGLHGSGGGGGDEDVTIRVTGKAIVKIQGAEIACEDGGEISIRGGSNGTALLRYDDSDQETGVGYYLEDVPDRRPRLRAPPRMRSLPAPVYDDGSDYGM